MNFILSCNMLIETLFTKSKLYGIQKLTHLKNTQYFPVIDRDRFRKLSKLPNKTKRVKFELTLNL
jgi:hypothetical protein